MDKILAWEGSVSIDRVGQGFDFERVSKVDDVYIFFNGLQIYGIYDKNGNYIKRTYRYNTDTYDYGYYDDNWKWITFDITPY